MCPNRQGTDRNIHCKTQKIGQVEIKAILANIMKRITQVSY